MANRFRIPMLRRQYDQMLHCFRTRHHDLIYPSGARCRGNAAAGAFWRGYDNVMKPNWDARSKQTPAYACFRAGQDARHLVDAGVYADVPNDQAWHSTAGSREATTD
jgi:hypothetical protein